MAGGRWQGFGTLLVANPAWSVDLPRNSNPLMSLHTFQKRLLKRLQWSSF